MIMLNSGAWIAAKHAMDSSQRQIDGGSGGGCPKDDGPNSTSIIAIIIGLSIIVILSIKFLAP